MCGIAGFVSRTQPLANRQEVISSLECSLKHRGPDDQGTYLSPDGLCGLTNTRLAILDLSAAGHQPMRSTDGRRIIVFNGEIYNFLALRTELEAAGMVFQSQSDTEVVLALYERLGPACVERLRGMFALAIWDEQAGTCFLARDPLGIKPLYYYHDEPGGLLMFASEIRSLLATGLVPKRLDRQGLYGYFRSGSVPEPLTMIAGVRCLEPGRRMSWQAGRVTRDRFWSLRFGSEHTGDDDETIAGVRAALAESVEHHFVSDVQVGLFLSGGIDSTAVLALARANGRANLRTFSIGFDDDAAADESGVARRTAEHFGAHHSEWRLNRASGRALFDEFLPHIDQPSVDGFNTYAVSRFTREQGIKVALSGLGGDEIFGGYPSFRQLPRMVSLSRRLGPLRGLAGFALGKISRRAPLQRLGDFLRQTPGLSNAYASYRGIHTDAEACALVARFTDAEGPLSMPEPEETADYPTSEDGISALEMQRYMSNQLLRDSDVMSMANGLELRVPFVDRCLIEAIARVPAGQRLRPGKELLLRAVPEVPPWVAGQPKRGFLFPFETWMAGDWGESPTTVTESAAPAQAGRTWYQKWSVFVFTKWWRQYSS